MSNTCCVWKVTTNNGAKPAGIEEWQYYENPGYEQSKSPYKCVTCIANTAQRVKSIHPYAYSGDQAS